MTSLPNLPNRDRLPSSAARASATIAAGTALAFAALLPVALTGCGKKEAPVVVETPPPPPPPPPAAPKVTPIAQLMASLNIDPRVRLSEEQAPDNDPGRVAVLQFFDGFVRGDASSLSGMLADPDRNELERLQKEGDWAKATESISRVDVRTGMNEQSQPCALAVFYTGAEFQPQLWTYTSGPGAEFSAEPTPPNVVEQLHGDDWIAAWYKILADELAKAEEPDEKVAIKSVNKDDQVVDENPSGSGLPVRGGGGAPGRRPAGEPIEPPGLRPGG